jgi:hypothetical protein
LINLIATFGSQSAITNWASPMSDYFSIQEIGGTELAQHYPDRGLIPDSNWYKAILTVKKDAGGFWGIFRNVESFIAVLSANTDGLRIFVSLDKPAIFIPWSDVSVAAERSRPATAVRLRTAAVPFINLEFHLDDTAADALFRGIIEPLPQRDPPGSLLWLEPWARRSSRECRLNSPSAAAVGSAYPPFLCRGFLWTLGAHLTGLTPQTSEVCGDFGSFPNRPF